MYIEKVELLRKCLKSDSRLDDIDVNEIMSNVNLFLQHLNSYVHNLSQDLFFKVHSPKISDSDIMTWKNRYFSTWFSNDDLQIIKDYFDKYQIEFFKDFSQNTVENLAIDITTEYYRYNA